MPRNATNKLLHKAQRSKMDEFYTHLCDIERELQYYPDCFRGKIVYCNCDDSRHSNFVRFFRDNFPRLGLKKLIASCYTPIQGGKGEYYEFCGGCDELIKPIFLNGNGDFRSDECRDLLKQSDIVVTNPPFSLFRDFIAEVVSHNKQFLVICSINAIRTRRFSN